MVTTSARGWIERLAGLDRGSCSPGETEAAELIAAALRSHGAAAHIERPLVHGTYWWPLGLTSAGGLLAAVAARRGRRWTAFALGAIASAAVVDDLGAGRRWLRRLLRKRSTANVLAWTGDPQGTRTLIVVAHHDAAHTGMFFNPRITEVLGQRFPSDTPGRRPPPVMLPTAAAPALAAIAGLAGSRRCAGIGAVVCIGIIGSMTHIALTRTVPGANDNLTGVATLLALAEHLQAEPPSGLRVLLLSTGAEEALMEGMRAFADRHFPALDPALTHVLCVDSVGSPHLVLAEGEGMLHVRPYDARFKGLIAQCAAEAGIELRRGMDMRLGTDGYLALRHGFPAALLMSVNRYGVASNYHWPTDTPDRVDYATLNDAVTLCERIVRRLRDAAA